MAVLASICAVLGVVTAVNLLLTVGVIRRLREHSERISKADFGSHAPRSPMIAAGETPKEFSAATIDGGKVSSADRPRPGLIAFFTSSCSSCREQAPQFLDYLGEAAFKSNDVLVVVNGDVGPAGDFAEQFRDLAVVVVEPLGAGISLAYNVSAYPSFAITGLQGTVAVIASSIDDLPMLEG